MNNQFIEPWRIFVGKRFSHKPGNLPAIYDETFSQLQLISKIVPPQPEYRFRPLNKIPKRKGDFLSRKKTFSDWEIRVVFDPSDSVHRQMILDVKPGRVRYRNFRFASGDYQIDFPGKIKVMKRLKTKEPGLLEYIARIRVCGHSTTTL